MSYYLGVLVATLLTLVIFSRVWRVNRGYQAAQYLLLGALAGYVAAVLLRNTLIPFFLGQLRGGFAGWIMVVLTLFLILLLALRFTRRSSWRVAVAVRNRDPSDQTRPAGGRR